MYRGGSRSGVQNVHDYSHYGGGGVALDSFGIATIPLAAVGFVAGSIIIATTLRNTIRNAAA